MKIELFFDVQPGEVWVNDKGYKLKVLDIDPTGAELWLEWENGRKGSWTPTKFIEARYRLYSHCEAKP